MEINLIADWRRVMQTELEAKKFKLCDDLDIAQQYFYYKSRLLKTKPRQVIRAEKFYCPPEWEKGLNKIIHKLENGSDMQLHLDLKITPDETPEDFLLADWNIYAFRLRKRVSADKEELGPVVFAYFKDVAAYLLTTKSDESWSVKEMISIVDSNWPKLLEEYRITGIVGQSAPIDSVSYAALRRKNKNIIISLDSGRVFCSNQQRYDDFGYRLNYVEGIERIERHLKRIETAIIKEKDDVLTRVKKESGKNLQKLHIILGRDKDGYAYIGEKASKVVLSRSEGLFDLN